MITRRQLGGGAVAFTVMRGGRFPKLRADVTAPLHLNGLRPWTPVTIDGKGPFRFMVGTGHTFFQVSTRLARTLNLAPAPSRMDTISEFGDGESVAYSAQTLTIGEVYPITGVAFLGSPSLDEGPYDGILPFLTDVTTGFDFEAGRLTFHPGKALPEAGAVRTPLQRAMANYFAKVPIIRGELDGQPLKLRLDTGIDSALSLNPTTVERLNLWDGEARSEMAEDVEVGAIEMQMSRGKSLRLAGFELRDPPVLLMRSEHARLTATEGQVGMEILRRFRITFDPYNEVVWLKPNGRFAEGFT